MEKEDYMLEALKEAKKAYISDEVPVGVVIVKNGEIIARGFNSVIQLNDPTAHAEVIALRNAGKFLKNYRLVNCEMYITLEPCMMCLGAIIHARINKIFFGAYEPKAGVVCSHGNLQNSKFLNHKIEVEGGILQQQCKNLLQDFFKSKRGK